MAAGSVYLFSFAIFCLGLCFNQNTSGPLLVFAGLVIACRSVCCWVRNLGSPQRARHEQPAWGAAVAVATGIGLAELVGLAGVFHAVLDYLSHSTSPGK
jgi:hypothetical protein